MKIIADTNLLLRAIIADDPGAALVARRRIQASSIVTIPTIAICEFVWVAMRAYKSPRHAVAKAIRDLVSDPKVVCDRDAVEAGLAIEPIGADAARERVVAVAAIEPVIAVAAVDGVVRHVAPQVVGRPDAGEHKGMG